MLIFTKLGVGLSDDEAIKRKPICLTFYALSCSISRYEESIQLRKNLRNAEEVTRECYELYRECKESVNDEMKALAPRTLTLAGKVHEIKKDNQRIYAGLSKMISNEIPADYMNMDELGRIIIRTNENYARMLMKEISFQFKLEVSDTLFPVYTTLSLINNLVANSVEAIKHKGMVYISVVQDLEWVEIKVADNGQGIKAKDSSLLFQPGFTTKYDFSGTPSTGIGLTFVKEMVDQLNGCVLIENQTSNDLTIFRIRIPVQSFLKNVS
jgi:two-component system sensor histidine kinase YcbA